MCCVSKEALGGEGGGCGFVVVCVCLCEFVCVFVCGCVWVCVGVCE